MIRKIIRIDEEKCNGCALCVNACHEGAITLQNGKAKLMRDDYCDGLGNCLPVCPTGAITFEEREAAAYDEQAVEAAQAAREKNPETPSAAPGGFVCPGTRARTLGQRPVRPLAAQIAPQDAPESELRQWPVQIKLIAPNAPYLSGAHLLIAADCTAYAYAGFHSKFMRGKITLIGCPKLDSTDYSEKLAQILSYNDIKSISVVRMEVPCCGGIVSAVTDALAKSGKMIPWSVTTIRTDGEIAED